MMTENHRADETAALTAALAAVALWSTVAAGFKLGLTLLEPLQLLLLGTTVSAAFFAATATVARSWRLDRATLASALLFGTINPLLYYLVLFGAYERLPAQIAQPLNYTWAITLALLAVPVLKQPLTRRMLGGIAVSYCGVLVLLSQGRSEGLPALNWLGVALALGSTVLWAGYWLLVTRASTPPLTLMATSFCLALPLVALACYLGPGWPRATWPALGYGLWVGLVEMGVTFLLWQRALRLTHNAARIGQLIFLSPFLSLIFIAALAGEDIQGASVAGLAIIVVGLMLTRRPGGTQPRTHAKTIDAP